MTTFVLIQSESHMTKHISKCLLAILIALTACTPKLTDIEAICENINDSHYIIKWEVWPDVHGHVDIYASTDPKKFDLESQPIARCKISDKICDINVDKTPQARYYFLLQFNNRYNYIVATRAPRIKNICNLRDLGGYENEQKKVVKWGFLFRSGCIHNVDSTGTKKLNSLGIRTLIDFNDHSRFSIPDSGLKIGQIKPAHQSHYDKPHLRTIEKRNLASGRCQYFPARPIHYAYRFGQTSLPGDVRYIARRRQLSGHTQRQVRERLCRLCQRTHTLRLEYPRRDYLRRLYPQ